MRIQSNEGITSHKSQQLKSLCNSIGTATVTCGGQTNLSAVDTVVSLFSKNNSIYKGYKNVLDADSAHINSIGAAFRNFDKNLIK